MITEAIIIGIVAWVFTNILISGDMVFSRWWWVLNRIPYWLANPLGACEYCLAGQIALWYFIYMHPYNICYHIAYCSMAILTVKTLNKLMDGT
jgi:hypothetical protein